MNYFFIEEGVVYPYVYTTCEEALNVLRFNGFEIREDEGVDRAFILDPDTPYPEYGWCDPPLCEYPRFVHEVIQSISMLDCKVVLIEQSEGKYKIGFGDFQYRVEEYLRKDKTGDI